MASEAKGKMYVPVWVDAGIVKALITDAGTMPVTESSPLASIQAQLYGDMADTWYKVRVSSGRSLHTHITGQTGDIEITQLDPAAMLVGSHGYTGAAWKKLGMLWGYHDRLATDLGGTKSGDGSYTAETSAVPAGEVWKVEALSIGNMTGARGTLLLQLYNGTVYLTIQSKLTPAIGDILSLTNPFTMKAGDKARVFQYSCVDADQVYGSLIGYSMDIAM